LKIAIHPIWLYSIKQEHYSSIMTSSSSSHCSTARPRCAGVNSAKLLVGLAIAGVTMMDGAEAFGIVSRSASQLFQVTEQSDMSEIAEAVSGEIYADVFSDPNTTDVVDETDKLLSRKIPVAIRYSGDAGMEPYYLTVAKKLKETHPDIVLDKVILPNVEMSDGKPVMAPTFEVMVDGKVVIPTVGKKDRDGMGGQIVYVSMQELDHAISRGRKRRRPSTVYGDDDSNVRLEMLKARVALGASNKGGPSHKHFND